MKKRNLFASSLAISLASFGSATLVMQATSSAGPIAQGADLTYAVLSGHTPALSSADQQQVGKLTENQSLGLSPARSALVAETATRKVYAVSAVDGKACLYQTSAQGTGIDCPSAIGRPAALVGWGSAIGLVPDSVSSVTFQMSDGTTQKGDVRGNIWTAPAEASLVSYGETGGTVSVELMPLSSKPDGVLTSLPK